MSIGVLWTAEEVPPEWLVWARKRYPTLNVEREGEKFTGHWLSTTKNAKKRNWFAAWRVWLAKADEYDKQRNRPPRSWERSPADERRTAIVDGAMRAGLAKGPFA